MRAGTVLSFCTLVLLGLVPSPAAAQQCPELEKRVRALEAALAKIEVRLSRLEKTIDESRQPRPTGDQSSGVVIIGGNQEDGRQAQERSQAQVTPTGPVSSSSSAASSTGNSKTVPVRGYYRKDGTYVTPHTRSTPRR